MWYLYILKCKDGTLYTGITNNIEKRVDEHNNGKNGSKYTRARRPLVLAYNEECKNRSEASKREAVVKKMSREEKLFLIKSFRR